VIAEYADALAARLAFDPLLARRVRAEVEDHLHEAAAAEQDTRRAIERFGDARTVAARFAEVSLAARVRSVGWSVALVAGVLYLAMQARLGWYALTEWALCEQAAPLAQFVTTLDRTAFWVALSAGAAAWLGLGRRRLFFCAIAAVAFAASVSSDGVLTFLRLADWDFSSDFLVPLGSMALETALTAVLLVRIYVVARLVSPTHALQQL
jgi:hypothetical protein